MTETFATSRATDRLSKPISSLWPRRSSSARLLSLLVQVNTTNEPQKFGCAVAAARHLCEQIDSLVHLRVRGLMCMGPASQDPEGTRFAFERARELFEEITPLKLCDGRFNILSMGMSGDYELAIEHGANMVRVGSAIFGPPRDNGHPSGDDGEDEKDGGGEPDPGDAY